MSKSILLLALIASALLRNPLSAQEPTPGAIAQQVREMQEKYEKRISALEGEVLSLKQQAASRPDDDAAALERAIAGLPAPASRPISVVPSFQVGAAKVSLLEISMDVLFAVGTSTAPESEILNLQGGGHDPKKRGFTLSQVELSGTGAVDPYFMAEAHIVYFIDPEGETEVELEEAFLTTTALPGGLQIEAGQSFLEFGRINPRHPHQWDFLDQPVINTRLFGGDGMRSQGVRIGWLTSLPWFCELHGGIYNANGETMTSFYSADEAIGGRPFVDQSVRDLDDLAYLMRIDNSFDLNKCTTMKLGASAVYGPNATGPGGHTWIYGADLLVKYKPLKNLRGWPFVNWQSELLFRDYHADGFFDPGDPANPFDDVVIAGDTLHDWGLYTQLMYGFEPQWIAGLRYEYASGSGDDVDETGASVSRSDDPFRDDRHRISALITYMPSEFSRLRLQCNYDRAQHLDHDALSIWLGVEFLFGKHPVHSY